MDRIQKRSNLKNLILLSLPIILEELLSVLLQYVDTAMVGQLGEQATAAVNLTTTVSWLIGSSFAAIGVSAVAMISTAFGAGDNKKVSSVCSHIVVYSIIFGALVCVLCITLSPYVPIWMQADVSIQERASEYFRIVSYAILFRSLWIVLSSCLRAIKDTRTPMIVSISVNVLNVILNYLFIYKLRLGTRGAALATLVSYTLAGIATLTVVLRNKTLKPSFKGFHFEKNINKEALHIGLPAFATSFASCMGHVVFASLVSSMGTTVFAAHSIALAAEELFYMPGFALRGATSTLIGISVGEKDKEKFRLVEKQSILLTMAMMTVTGAMLFFLARPLMAFFTPSEAVIEKGSQVLRLIATSEPIYGLMIAAEGIYYGLGRTKNTFVVSAVGSWGIRILSTVLLLRLGNPTLLHIWICMFCDNAFRAMALALPLVCGKDIKFFEKRQTES